METNTVKLAVSALDLSKTEVLVLERNCGSDDIADMVQGVLQRQYQLLETDRSPVYFCAYDTGNHSDLMFVVSDLPFEDYDEELQDAIVEALGEL